MKTIVIAGGGSNVGKTTLARKLTELLPNARAVKLGTHPPKPGKPGLFFPIDTPWSEVNTALGNCGYAIVESGSLLDDPELEPDLIIFLPTPAGRTDKPGSKRRRQRADLVRGEPISRDSLTALERRLALDEDRLQQVLIAAGVPIR